MTYVQTITNGNLPIPREIRESLQWPKTDLKVKIEQTKKGFKVEQVSSNNTQLNKKKLTKKQWDVLLEDMKRISKFGRRGVNLTEFIRKDRDTHF